SDLENLPQLALDLVGHRRIVPEPLASVILALTDAVAVVRIPGTSLVNNALPHPQLDQLAFAGDALAVQHFELGLLKRRRQLVLDHLDPGLVADDLVAALDGADATDVEAHRGVELERVAAGRGLRAAEHHADLHADLVDEDHQRVGTLDVGGQLAQRLAHQAGLQADVRVA